MYGGHLIRVINARAIGVVRYSSGILGDRELGARAVKTRKILTMLRVFHKKCKRRGSIRGYQRRHDPMFRLYWELCRKTAVKCADAWYKEVPDEVRVSEDGNVEIW